MWPSDNTVYLLIFGLIPLAYVILLVKKNGYQELSSLRFSGILLIWVGYQLSPWISYFTNEAWDNYLLVLDYVDVAILFSSIAMIAFLWGYSLFFTKKITKARKNQISVFRS